MRTLALVPLVLAAALSLAAGDCATGRAERTVTMRFSRFEPVEIVVPVDVPVRFTLRNDDPIEHEWIVGTEDVHARHRTGTEPYHDEIPTEVTVPALSSRATTVTFEHAGRYRYVCHLPGHEAYGMTGMVRVVE